MEFKVFELFFFTTTSVLVVPMLTDDVADVDEAFVLVAPTAPLPSLKKTLLPKRASICAKRETQSMVFLSSGVAWPLYSGQATMMPLHWEKRWCSAVRVAKTSASASRS